MPHDVPHWPWEKVGADLFELNNKDYLITVDYLSNFFEIYKLENTKASTVIRKLKSHFARYGTPDRVVSDNGPQFTSDKFEQFTKEWEFDHLTISPGNSKANGKAESAVKTAKRLMRKAADSGSDPYLALLDYRNTPTQGIGSSPAQRLMNRRTKTLLPTSSSLLQPRVSSSKDKHRKLVQRQDNQAKLYNKSAKNLAAPAEGETVRMQPFKLGDKTWRKATVLRQLV